MKQEMEAHAARLHHGQGRRREDSSVNTPPPSPGMQLSRAIHIGGALLHKKSGSADTSVGLSLGAPLKMQSIVTHIGAAEPPTSDAADTAPSATAFARGERRAGKGKTEDSGVCISPEAEGSAMTAMTTPSGLMMTMIHHNDHDPPASPLSLPSPRKRVIEKKERLSCQLRMQAETLQEQTLAPDASGAPGRPLHAPAATGRPLRRMSIKEYDAFIGKYSPDIDAGAARSESDGIIDGTKGRVAGRSQPEAQHD